MADKEVGGRECDCWAVWETEFELDIDGGVDLNGFVELLLTAALVGVWGSCGDILRKGLLLLWALVGELCCSGAVVCTVRSVSREMRFSARVVLSTLGDALCDGVAGMLIISPRCSE